MSEERLLTSKELRDTLRVSKTTIQNWRNQGMPVAVDSDMIKRYRWKDVIEWLNEKGVKGKLKKRIGEIEE